MKHVQDLAEALSAVLATETCGWLRHLADASPHLTGRTYDLFALVRRMAAESGEHARRICELMQTLELQPPPALFSAHMAAHHYVALETHLPQLIAEKQRQIAAYHEALRHVADNAPARRELETLLAATAAHGQQLEDAARGLADAAAEGAA